MNTEITLPASELKTALSGFNKIIGRKSSLPVLSHVRVSRQKNGLVTLQATDLDAYATFTLINTQSGEPVDLLVPLEQLNKAFKCSGSKEDLALVCEAKSTKLRYFIGGNPVHQPVVTLPVNEWPPVPQITAPCTPLPAGFGEALKQALQCCSDDSSRHTLQGACLDASDKEAHYVVATNASFLYSANSFTFPLKESIIIPNSRFINGSGLLDNEPCLLAVQPGKKPSQAKHICLQNKQWQFVTREIEGQYPNWKPSLPTPNSSWTLVKLSRPAIEQMLAVIPDLPGYDSNTNTVKLRLGTSSIWVEGKNKDDSEWTKIAIPDVTITGKAREIAVNRDYLLPALKFGLNELHILDEGTPMVCSKEGKRVVIVPVSIKGPKATPATPPEASQPGTPQERTDMAKDTSKTEASKTTDQLSLIDQIEQIKDTLKDVVRDLSSLVDAVKQMEKDNRATEKEVETARAVLKKLQQVTI